MDSTYIYSRSTHALAFDLPFGKIVLAGGSGVVNRKSLDTPYGVATRIYTWQLDELKKHPVFQKLIKAGALKVDNRKLHPDDAGADLDGDKSAQRSAEEHQEKTGTKITKGTKGKK